MDRKAPRAHAAHPERATAGRGGHHHPAVHAEPNGRGQPADLGAQDAQEGAQCDRGALCTSFDGFDGGAGVSTRRERRSAKDCSAGRINGRTCVVSITGDSLRRSGGAAGSSASTGRRTARATRHMHDTEDILNRFHTPAEPRPRARRLTAAARDPSRACGGQRRRPTDSARLSAFTALASSEESPMASRRLQLGPPDAGTVTPGAGGAQSQAHLVAGCHMRRWARADWAPRASTHGCCCTCTFHVQRRRCAQTQRLRVARCGNAVACCALLCLNIATRGHRGRLNAPAWPSSL